MVPFSDSLSPPPDGVLGRGSAPEAAALGQQLLTQIAEVFRADAGFFLHAGSDGSQLSTLGIGSQEARSMASELHAILDRSGREGCSLGSDEVGARCSGWPSSLVTRVDAGGPAPGPSGLLALFSEREGSFDPVRDGRVASLLGRNAAVAVAQSLRQAHLERRAERRDVQVEELERVRSALESHSQEIERSLALRSRFFASMSHELRTPINAIVGYNDLLRHGVFGALNERQIGASEKIKRCADQLLSLIRDVLDFARIDAGEVPIRVESLDLSVLVAEASSTVELDAVAKDLDFRVVIDDPVPLVESDSDRVRQILLNLLSNAVKFTYQGSIVVRVRHLTDTSGLSHLLRPRCSPGSDGWVALSVHDTGVGVPEDQLDRIFDDFVRVSHADHSVPGTGLGLSISAHLAHLLGGDLRVESRLGSHSTFMLFLPCPVGPESRDGVGASSSPATARVPEAAEWEIESERE